MTYFSWFSCLFYPKWTNASWSILWAINPPINCLRHTCSIEKFELSQTKNKMKITLKFYQNIDNNLSNAVSCEEVRYLTRSESSSSSSAQLQNHFPFLDILPANVNINHFDRRCSLTDSAFLYITASISAMSTSPTTDLIAANNTTNNATTNMNIESISTQSSIQLTELSFKIIYTALISQVLDSSDETVRANIQLQSVGSVNVDNNLNVESIKSCVRRYTHRHPQDDKTTRIFIAKVCALVSAVQCSVV